MVSTSLQPPRRGALTGQFASFCIVGGGGFVVDAGTLAIALNLLHLDAYSGRILSYLVAATFTWVLNRRFTFGASRNGNLLAEWVRYLLAGAVGGLANFAAYSAVVALVHHFIGTTGAIAAIAPYAGVGVGSALGLMVNFTLTRKLVFRQGREAAAPPPSDPA